MASIAELAREHCGLDGPHVVHLQRLVRAWGLLADLCFSDLLLFGRSGPNPGNLVLLQRFTNKSPVREVTNHQWTPLDGPPMPIHQTIEHDGLIPYRSKRLARVTTDVSRAAGD